MIGWATCWDGCDDPAHHAIVDILLGHGARHHIYSAIALGLADEVRRLAAANPDALRRPMSRNENFQVPLHFAIRRNRPAMVSLLLAMGADPSVPDGTGMPTVALRGEDRAVAWLLEHSLDPNTRWSHWGALVTPLHLAAWQGHAQVVRQLLQAGADPAIRDSLHDGDAMGWAGHAGQTGIVEMLEQYRP